MKIRNKLTLRFSFVVATLLLLFSLAVFFFYALYRQAEFYDRLEEKAYTTVRLLTEVQTIDPEILRTIDRNELTSLFAEEVKIYNEANSIIYDSGNENFPVSEDLLRQVREGQTVQWRTGEKEFLGVLYSDKQRRLAVLISAQDKYGFSKMDQLTQTLLVGWLMSVGVVVLAGWIFSGNALHPVSAIVQQVREIKATNLHARLETGNNHDELAQLAGTFNNMLARLEEAFLTQKSFVSHASHELRTPLAVLTSQIEVTLMQPRSSAEYQATLESVLEEIRKMTSLVNSLLVLTRVQTDTGTGLPKKIRVDELLWEVAAELTKKKPDCAAYVSFEEVPEDESLLTIPGDETLLKMAFFNLMENGCKYSDDKRVQVAISARPGQLQVRFSDHGAGIAEADLPHIFEPFYRSQRTRHVTGHGIGLALTQKIIHLHSGLLHVQSAVDQGTTVTTTFARC